MLYRYVYIYSLALYTYTWSFIFQKMLKHPEVFIIVFFISSRVFHHFPSLQFRSTTPKVFVRNLNMEIPGRRFSQKNVEKSALWKFQLQFFLKKVIWSGQIIATEATPNWWFTKKIQPPKSTQFICPDLMWRHWLHPPPHPPHFRCAVHVRTSSIVSVP